MSEWFKTDFSEVWEIQTYLDAYGAGYGRVVDKVLHGEGADAIKRAIPGYIHPSNRKWKGKTPSIAGNPDAGKRLSQDDHDLGVTIAARGKLGYLYFPDDGSNTDNHAGNQQFMRRGAESQMGDILDRCVGALIDSFEKGR